MEEVKSMGQRAEGGERRAKSRGPVRTEVHPGGPCPTTNKFAKHPTMKQRQRRVISCPTAGGFVELPATHRGERCSAPKYEKEIRNIE